MTLKIDKKLNLVIPVDRADGSTVYVHSTPLHKDIVALYIRPLAKTFTEIYTQGFGIQSAPKITSTLLRANAKSMGVLDGPEGVEKGLFGEIKRLTNVLAPKDGGGWETVSLENAVKRGFLDEDDFDEVESATSFFMLASALHKRSEVPIILEWMTRSFAGELTSSNASEFADGLPKSIEIETSPAKAIAVSIPS
jgi:hypothetical protein